MRFIIQLVLVAFTVAIVWRLLSSSGQRTQAVRRLGFAALGLLAILSILFPKLWSQLARLVGVGRGTDLIVYGLVVAFFSFVVTSFRRNRDLEVKYTQLARRLALDEAAARSERETHPTLPEDPPTADTVDS